METGFDPGGRKGGREVKGGCSILEGSQRKEARDVPVQVVQRRCSVSPS